MAPHLEGFGALHPIHRRNKRFFLISSFHPDNIVKSDVSYLRIAGDCPALWQPGRPPAGRSRPQPERKPNRSVGCL